MHRSARLTLLITLIALIACGKDGGDHQVFKLLSAQQTGVRFSNTITANDSFNVQTDVYIYNLSLIHI